MRSVADALIHGRRFMMRMTLILLAVLIAFGTLLSDGSTSPVRAQSDETRAVQITAESIFQLAADRKFNAMYDRIHPDAHAIVPRAAAVGTFDELYAIAQAGKSEITDIQFGPWTWGVTGKTYDHAAAVAFTQAYVENGETK